MPWYGDIPCALQTEKGFNREALCLRAIKNVWNTAFILYDHTRLKFKLSKYEHMETDARRKEIVQGDDGLNLCILFRQLILMTVCQNAKSR